MCSGFCACIQVQARGYCIRHEDIITPSHKFNTPCTSLHTFSSYPYIFFNEDKVSITFVGFMVTQNGDLVDPALRAVLEPAIMRPQLYTGLKHNRVDFDRTIVCGVKPE